MIELLVALVLGLTTSAVLVWVCTVYLRHKLRTPPASWLDLVSLAKSAGTGVPVSIKTPVLRRQLALASTKPALFTNLVEMSLDSVDLKALGKPTARKIIGFFHPNANAGGGGERVLYAAVKQTLVNKDNIATIYVASQSNLTPKILLEQATDRFGIVFTAEETARIVVTFLTQTRLVEPQTYPFLTLFGQALGQAVLGYEAISNFMPDVFVDTMGLPFSYPVVSWFARVPVVAYVHYPFVQSDMLRTLPMLSLKQAYWRGLMLAYRWAGSFTSLVMANSTWTKAHLNKSWKQTIEVVYPPVAVQDFTKVTGQESRANVAVYVAQFRPEKRHSLVIRAFGRVARELKREKPHLILIGSVRHTEDAQRVLELKQLAKSVGLDDSSVTFVENAPWVAVRKILESSLIGVNAMWNEHFGMGVVEVMAAGLIPVVHASAGPLLDIVKDSDESPGFFFQSKSDPGHVELKYPRFSDALITAFHAENKAELGVRAYAAAQKFSDHQFYERWNTVLPSNLDEPQRKQRKRAGLYD